MPKRRMASLALAIALASLALWRAACVMSGPEVDTDAYAHHMIARAILADPRDLAVHWVWLPLFHYLQVPLVAAGGTLQSVRWINVVLAAIGPAVLFAYVRRTVQQGPDFGTRRAGGLVPEATALFAALVSAACPIAMQMGTTAQPEPLFGLLMLGVAIGYQERRYTATACLLCAAALMRYEAWAGIATVAVVSLVDPLRRRMRGLAGERDPWRPWMVVFAPVAAIVAWATLRKPFDGRWFGFLRETHQFASGAMHQSGALEGGLPRLLEHALYYPLSVPIHVLGPVVMLVPLGIVRTVREQGARFVLVLLSTLAFISLTWVMRSSLGLDRHFVVVVPLYATFAAQGLTVVAGAVGKAAERLGLAHRIGTYAAAAVGVASLGGLLIALQVWMGFWRGAIERGWPSRQELGAYLQTLPESSLIFCDDATLELLSGVDRRRFDRHWLDDSHTWDLVENAARARGVAYVATWKDKTRGHEDAGTVVYHVRDNRDDPASELVVMRVTGG